MRSSARRARRVALQRLRLSRAVCSRPSKHQSQNVGARSNGRFRTAEYTSNDIKWRAGQDLLPQQVIFLLSPSFAGRDHAADYSVRYAATACARKIPALSAPPPPGKLRVQIQPIALKAAGEANGTARPSRVEVTIVSA